MKKIKGEQPIEALIEGLESLLAEKYSSRFVIDLQEMCGLHTMREYFGKSATSSEKRNQYAAMLRGAWYASLEKKK